MSPLYQETLNAGMCGAASLKIVLDFYGIQKSEAELAYLLDINPDLGTDNLALKRVAESLGFSVTIRNEATFDDIEKWLQKGIPVIVNWFTARRREDESGVPDGHYSVVEGLDNEKIYLQDPEIGRIRAIDRESFLSAWFDFRGATIRPDEFIIRQCIALEGRERISGSKRENARR